MPWLKDFPLTPEWLLISQGFPRLHLAFFLSQPIPLLQRLKVVAMAKKIITTLKGCNNLLLQRLNVVTLFGLKLLQPFSNCYNI